ncbi:MAG: hypothetical protein KA352_00480 [Flavobacteriales bacterium]|nr:hypothetical protein [Flavobacteriales bacterium]
MVDRVEQLPVDRVVDRGPILLAQTLCVLVLVLRLVGSSAWDLGDGALHYLQARHSWQHAHLFFDQWAKPLYVLLGSSFAQLGGWGMTLFNTIVAGATAILLIALLRERSALVRWAVPILLLGATQYFRMVISGMTEPLFGLITVLCVHFLIRERWAWAMVTLSLSPWARPEYVAFAPCAVAFVLYHRQSRALLWLLPIPLLYLATGLLVLGEKFWLFAKDPYLGNTAYGQGSMDHFLARSPEILGVPLLCLATLAVPLLGALFWRDVQRRAEHATIIWLAVVPVLGIWMIHSYAYWAGGHASSGLIRVLATTVPLTVLFTAHAWGALLPMRMHRWTCVAGGAGILALALWAQDDLRLRIPLPAQADTEQRQVALAAAEARQYLGPDVRIVSGHPYFAEALGLDVWDPTRVIPQQELDRTKPGARLDPGDLIVWDHQYLGEDGKFDVHVLLNDPSLTLLNCNSGGSAWGKYPFMVCVFQRSDTPEHWTTDTIADLSRGLAENVRTNGMGCGSDTLALLCSFGDEFPVTFKPLEACTDNDPYTEWIVSYRLKVGEQGTTGLHFVLTEQVADSTTTYHQIDLGADTGVVRFPLGRAPRGALRGIYLWNENGSTFSAERMCLVRRCLRQN